MTCKLPYLPLWPKDYLSDTFGLTTEQHGGYLLLLMQAWLRPSCSVPNDDDWLATHAGMTPTQWQRNRERILAFWKLDRRRNEWTQKRLKAERKKAEEKSRAAKNSAASRWNKNKKNTPAAMRSNCSPDPYPDPNGKTNGFPNRAAAREKKSSGFVKQRNAADAAISYIEKRGLSDDTGRKSESSEIVSDDVQLLPAIGTRRR